MSYASPTTGKQIIERAKRREQAVRMRASGATLRQIGERLGCSEKTAYRDVQAALDDLAKYTAEQTSSLRELMGVRLEQMILDWSLKARDDPIAAGIVLKALAQRAQLYGLNAPQSVAITQPITAVNLTLIPPEGKQEVIEMKPAALPDGSDRPSP